MQKEAKIETGASAALSDYDAITNTVQNYINGGKTGRTADMKLAFHPDATIFGYIGPDLFAGPIQGLFDWNDKNGPATELQGRITSIDLIETVATVRLELDNWTGHRFTDFFFSLSIHDGGMIYITVDPRWQPSHGDTQFIEVVRRVGLPQ